VGNATRADVAAWVYQALVYLKRAPQISYQYILVLSKVPRSTVSVSHQREFRGVWITNIRVEYWLALLALKLSAEQQKTPLP